MFDKVYNCTRFLAQNFGILLKSRLTTHSKLVVYQYCCSYIDSSCFFLKNRRRQQMRVKIKTKRDETKSKRDETKSKTEAKLFKNEAFISFSY